MSDKYCEVSRVNKLRQGMLHLWTKLCSAAAVGAVQIFCESRRLQAGKFAELQGQREVTISSLQTLRVTLTHFLNVNKHDGVINTATFIKFNLKFKIVLVY